MILTARPQFTPPQQFIEANRLDSALAYINKFPGCRHCQLRQCDKTIPHRTYNQLRNQFRACKCLKQQGLFDKFRKTLPDEEKLISEEAIEEAIEMEDLTRDIQALDDVNLQQEQIVRLASSFHINITSHLDEVKITVPKFFTITTDFHTLKNIRDQLVGTFPEMLPVIAKIWHKTFATTIIAPLPESKIPPDQRRKLTYKEIASELALAIRSPSLYKSIEEVKLASASLSESMKSLESGTLSLKDFLESDAISKRLTQIEKVVDSSTSCLREANSLISNPKLETMFKTKDSDKWGYAMKIIGVIMALPLYSKLSRNDSILLFFNQMCLLGIAHATINMLLQLPSFIRLLSKKNYSGKEGELKEQSSDLANLIGPAAQIVSLGIVAATSNTDSKIVTKIIKAGNVARTVTNVKNMTDVVKVSMEEGQKCLFEAVTGLPGTMLNSMNDLEPLTMWMDMISETLDNPDWMATYLDDPENQDIMDQLIIQGDIVLNECLKDVSGEALKFRSYVKNNLDKLRKLSTSFRLAMTGNRNRPLPVSVLFYGPANVGKTYTCNNLASDLLTMQPEAYRKRFKDHNSIIYTKPQNSDYFSGYNGQFVYMEDELFQINTSEELSKSIATVFQFIQETSAPLNQAELELKGRIHFSSKFVFFTSNRTNLENLPLTESRALLRRFHYTVMPMVRENFRTAEGFINLGAWEEHCAREGLNSSIPNYALFAVQDSRRPGNPIQHLTYHEMMELLLTNQHQNEARFTAIQGARADRFTNGYTQEDDPTLGNRANEVNGEIRPVDFWAIMEQQSKEDVMNALRIKLELMKQRVSDSKQQTVKKTLSSYKFLEEHYPEIAERHKFVEKLRLSYAKRERVETPTDEDIDMIFYIFLIHRENYFQAATKLEFKMKEWDFVAFKDKAEYKKFVSDNDMPSPGLFKFAWMRFYNFVKKHPIVTGLAIFGIFASVFYIALSCVSEDENSRFSRLKKTIFNSGNNESKAYNHADNKNKLPAFNNNLSQQSDETMLYNNILISNTTEKELPDEAVELYEQAVTDNNLEAQLGKIIQNTVSVTISDSPFFYTCTTQKGLIIRSDFLLINTHLIKYPQDKSYIKVTTHNSTFEVKLSDCTMYDIGDRWKYADATIIVFPKSKLNGQDIVKMFMRKDNIENFHDGWGELIVTETQKIVTRHASKIEAVTTTDPVHIEKRGQIVRGYIYSASTEFGDCGSPLCVWDNRTSGKILGIHAAGGMRATHTGYSTIVDREWLEGIIKEHITLVPSSKEIKYGERYVAFANNNEDLDVVMQPKSELMPLAMNIIGHAPIKTSIPLGRSQVVPSDFQLANFSQPKEAPVIRTITGVDSSLAKVLRKFRSDTPYVDRQLTSTITNTIALKYFNNSDRDRQIYSPEEGLNILKSIRSIDISTSMGFPWCTAKLKKKDYVRFNEQDNHYEFTDKQFLEVVNSKIEEMEQLRLPEFIFVNCLKDERLPIDKVKDNKVRLFMLCPFDLTLIVRMYFGSFIDSMHSKIFELGVCVGIAPQTEDWNTLAHTLLKHSSDLIAIDYSNWDRSIPIEFLEIFFDLADMYYSDQHINIRRCVRSAILNPVYQLNWFRYRVQSGNPSGCPVTTELNSIANLGMTLYVLTKSGHDFHDVLQQTYVATYGDDSVISTAIDVDIEKLGDEIKKLGLIATNSRKTSSIRVEKLNEVVFLKRNFVYFNGRYYAPLIMDTVVEMLLWVKRGINQKSNFQCTITNALEELQQFPPQEVSEFYYKLMNFCYRCNYDFKFNEHAYQSLMFSKLEQQSIMPNNINFSENLSLYMFKIVWNLMNIDKEPLIFEDVDNIIPSKLNYVGIDVGRKLPFVNNRIFYHVGFRSINFPGKELTFSDKGVSFIKANYEPEFSYEVSVDKNKIKEKILHSEPYDRVRNNCISFCEEVITDFSNVNYYHQRLFKRMSEKTILDNRWLYVQSKEDDITATPSCSAMKFMEQQENTDNQEIRSMDQLLESGSLILNKKWSTNDNRETTTKIYFPGVLMLSEQFKQKMAYNTLYKADLSLTIEVTNPVSLCGALMINWIPSTDQGYYAGHTHTLGSLSSMDNTILSVPNNNEVCLNIPFNNYKNFLHFNTKYKDELGTLIISVLSPLVTSVSSEESTVSILVYANFVNVQAIISTPLTTQSTWVADRSKYPAILAKNAPTTQGTLFIESDEQLEKSSEGVISTPAATISTAARLLSGIPVISGVASTISVISSGISTIAQAMGLSKPRNLQSTSYMIPNIFPNVGYADAQDNGAVLGLDPRNHVVIQPSLFGSNKDELNINYLIRKYTLISQSHWSITHTPGTTLFQIPVHPFMGRKTLKDTYQCIEMSHMGYIGTCFTYWRGSIKVKFLIHSTESHSGSLILGFIPKGSWPSDKQFVFETTIKKRIEIKGGEVVTEAEFVIPYISTQMMNKLKTPFSAIDLEEDSAIGMLILKVEKTLIVTKLISPKLYIQVYVAAGEDFDFALPDLNKLSTYIYSPTLKVQALESNLKRTTRQRNDLVMGESIKNLRQLMKISVLKFDTAHKLSPGYNQIIFPAHTFTGTDDDSEVHDTFYTHFMRLYRYSRGSIRHKIMFNSFEGKVSAIMASTNDNDYEWTTEHSLEGAPWCTTHAKLAPYLEYEIPFYSTTKMQIHGTHTPERKALVQFQNFETQETPIRLTLHESIGDDFSAGYIMGVPPLYLKPSPLIQLLKLLQQAKAPSDNFVDDYYVYGPTKVKCNYKTNDHTSEIVYGQKYYYTSYMKRYTLIVAAGEQDIINTFTVADDNNSGIQKSTYFCFIDKTIGFADSGSRSWDSYDAYNGLWFYLGAGTDIKLALINNKKRSGNTWAEGFSLRTFRTVHPRSNVMQEVFKLIDKNPFKGKLHMIF
nr:MAG: polyprotein [Picornavirales sp.]